MCVREGRDTVNAQWISAISLSVNLSPSLSPSFSRTHIHLPMDAMSLTWREEHLHFSSPVSPNSHADSRGSECVRLRERICVRVCLCLSVCEYAYRYSLHYLLTSMSSLHICTCLFELLSPLVQTQGACGHVFVFWHVLYIVKKGCSLAKHLYVVRHGAYSRQKHRRDLVKRVFSNRAPQGRREHMENMKISNVWHIFPPCAILHKYLEWHQGRGLFEFLEIGSWNLMERSEWENVFWFNLLSLSAL